MTINRIQPAVAEVRGYTVYNIYGLDEQGNPAEDSMIVIRTKGGIAEKMTSRADQPTALMGTKRMIVSSGYIYVGKGKADGMPIIIIPLLGDNNFVNNLLLMHIHFNETLSLSEKTRVLGYRYHDIKNIVNEFNMPWRDEYLESFTLEELFSEPVEFIAGQIKTQFGQP